MTTIPYLEEELEKTTKQLNYYKNYSNRLLNDNKKKDKEIERLNNIIDELEKILYKRNLDDYDTYTANVVCDFQSDFNEILRELKESGVNENNNV